MEDWLKCQISTLVKYRRNQTQYGADTLIVLFSIISTIEVLSSFVHRRFLFKTVYCVLQDIKTGVI